MTGFDPKDKNFEARVRTSFARQTAMATLGIEITGVTVGEVELKMPYAAAYAQQHGLSMPASSPRRSIQPAAMQPFR